ncbi:hypothetical protein ABVK25_005207 [Lepraria finkii]|uniref:Uncharacterized protein n=1 Tax=Lepraria finkii TaxID=1340010 RepID=A0ABR4B9D9_9LECA
MSPTGTISAISCAPEFMDIFAVDTGGNVWTVDFQPGDTGFQGWWSVAGGKTKTGFFPSVSRSLNKLDVFTIGTENRAYTAAWGPGFNGFHEWRPTDVTLVFPAGTSISAIS